MYNVSVIVPVFNAEKYIERCARSVLGQTLEGTEILFIDDCSVDNSLEILECLIGEFAQHLSENKSVARIIRMPFNSGQAAVRREGITQTTGAYIIHCDADDWVDIDLYERMYTEAVRINADIVLCDYYLEYASNSEVRGIVLHSQDSKEIIRQWYKKCIGMHCWNKMIRRTIYINNKILPWDGLNMWEDNGLMTRLFYYGGVISHVSDTYYHYNRANTQAMTAGYGIKQVEQMIGVAEHLSEFFDNNIDSQEFRKTKLAFQFLARINLITDSFEGLRKYNRLFKESDSIISEIDTNAFSFYGRIRYYMVRHHLAWLFIVMYKIKNIMGHIINA